MISIKKLLNADPETAPWTLQVAQVLLKGIGEHAIRCDPEEYAKFRESMEKMATTLDGSAGGPENMAQAEAAIRSLEKYNSQTAQQLRVRGTELQGMVKMLTAAIGDISTAGEENVSRLRRIEGLVSSVTQIDDVRAVKAQLSVCLDEIRHEAERQKVAATDAVNRLRQSFDRVQTGSSTDAVTGLPMRAEAAELLANACESGHAAIAVVMVIDRLAAVNTAFGPEAGDQLLRYFSGYVRRGLSSSDQLFRWTGASLLALVARSHKIESLRAEIKLLMDEKLEFTARTATRSVRVPVTARWAMFAMMSSPQLLIQKIDGFAMMQPPKN